MGLAYPIFNQNGHCDLKPINKLVGTLPFASINSHEKI